MSKDKNFWMAIALNCLAIIAVAALLGWLSMWFVGLWTGHGKNAVVPNVAGMYVTEAEEALRADGFMVEISDSVYDTKVGPGVVVDQNPRRNTQVKPGRLIYLTINAMSPKMVTLPRLCDISARQARAILEGLGLKKIIERPVESEFKDLVIDVEADGVRVQPGARVPINSTITLDVGQGIDEFGADSLSTATDAAEASAYLDLF